MSDTWLDPAVAAAAGLLLAGEIFRIAWKIGKRLARSRTIARTLMENSEEPARLLLSLPVLQAVWQAAPDSHYLTAAVRHITLGVLIATVTWLVGRIFAAA